MGFARQLFISYAHIDNQPLTPQQQGWITRFHASLAALLSMRIGRKAEIWRDDKLRGNDIFADEITDQFHQTALLVSVLTPRYLASEWCTRELRAFCVQAERSGGVVLGNKARVFKVLKAPIASQAALPAVLKDMLGYEFFAFDDGAPLELDAAYGERFAQDYNRKVGKLAWDMAQLLGQLEAQAPSVEAQAPPVEPPGAVPAAARRSIYLAECSYDRRDAREMIESDLLLHGYRVLPEQRLPIEDEAAYVAALDALLAGCCLSIHLIGSQYGAVPDGPGEKSVGVLQNEAAARRSRHCGMLRLIWLPQATHSDHPAQQGFIRILHEDAAAQFGADLVSGDLEEFKTTLHATLARLERPPPAPPEKQPVRAAEAAQARADAAGPQALADDAPLVLVLCDEKDRKATIGLRKLLKQAGLDPRLPAFEGDAAALREANQRLLGSCDAVLLYYGAGDDAWKRSTDSELKKSRGLRAGTPWRASLTYLAEPATSDKIDLIEMDAPAVVDGLAGLAETRLLAFAQTLRAPSAPT